MFTCKQYYSHKTIQNMGMKNIKFLLVAFVCLICTAGKSQVPQSPIINFAMQVFKQNGEFIYSKQLIVSQNISPRVMKPGHPNATEKVRIMFIGNWLDITNEVKVFGPGSSSSKGVTALSDFRKGNNGIGNAVKGEVINNYKGPYLEVNFLIASDAAVGTHRVSLRRPRLGLGYDETIFYIEVYDVVRIHSIKFSNDLLSTGKKNQRGKITIFGQNLNRITSLGNCGGKLSNITDFQKSDNKITCIATLANTGKIDYAEIMNSVTPGGLIHSEYPSVYAVQFTRETQPHLTIVN
jgi:hypothetical protein